MADEQISLTSFILIVVLGGLIVRYLFFSSSSAAGSPATLRGRDAASASRAREAAVERIQQMFPQIDRRTILWELQRNGGNMTATTERILAGRIENPPVTFQPPPPPTSPSPSSTSQPAKIPFRPTEPDLITRYKLQNKITNSQEGSSSESAEGKAKAWSSSRDERQTALQRRRDEMILAARRKMEAKIAAEKASAGGASSSA
ncbi:hypothetical protein F5Y19DRAFT_296589 [Xylariaceae sp. FL1651]|nr:hypothetical protein F5Y19DRAFT_296589 [Xylariaceae sp. FL1651]